MKRVIGTLSEGFEMILRQPWILLLPVLLDVFLWLGPRISLAPLISQGADWILGLSAQMDPATQLGMEQAWEEMGMQGVWEILASRFNLLSVIPSINLVSLLSLGVLDLPSVIAAKQLDSIFPGESSAVIQIDNGLAAVGLFGLLVLVGISVMVLYQGLIAQQVRDRRIDLHYLAGHAAKYLIYVLAVLIALVGIFMLVGGPLSLVLFFVGYFSPTLMQILLFIAGGVVLWFSLYFIFLIHGILLDEEPPIRALWASMNIVHKDFWAVILMLVLVRLIRTGFLSVWSLFTGTVPGVVVAILGNAFLSAGLAAATFCFYRDSLVAWKEHLAKLAMLKWGGPGASKE